jgi:propanediol dehydratase small subunit
MPPKKTNTKKANNATKKKKQNVPKKKEHSENKVQLAKSTPKKIVKKSTPKAKEALVIPDDSIAQVVNILAWSNEEAKDLLLAFNGHVSNALEAVFQSITCFLRIAGDFV